MYGEGKKALERGLSFGARLLLAFVAGLVGIGMITMASESLAPMGFYTFGAFCLAIALACVLSGRPRALFGRLVGASIFAASAWYLGGALMDGVWDSGSRARPSIVNAATFFVLAGVPGLLYAALGRFRVKQGDASERDS